jgi:hypothetical protein
MLQQTVLSIKSWCYNEQFLLVKSWCYNEQFLSIKSKCYNEHGGILFIMESSITVFTRKKIVGAFNVLYIVFAFY